MTPWDVLGDVALRSQRYLAGLGERRVGPAAEALAALAALDGPLQDDPLPAAQIVDEIAAPATIVNAGGRYFGFVIGGSLPAALAANWLASAWDQNAGPTRQLPERRGLEEISVRWVLDVLGLPGDRRRGLRHRGDHGELRGLAAARHAVLQRRAGTSRATGCSVRRRSPSSSGDEVHATRPQGAEPARLGRRARRAGPGRRAGRDARRGAAAALEARRSSASRRAT